MENKVKFERRLTNVGGSLAIVIPPEVIRFANLSQGDTIYLSGEKGKHGSFIALWKKEE